MYKRQVGVCGCFGNHLIVFLRQVIQVFRRRPFQPGGHVRFVRVGLALRRLHDLRQACNCLLYTSITDRGSPTLLARRQEAFRFCLQVRLDFDPLQDGEEAGLIVFLTGEHYYKLTKLRRGGQNYLTVYKQAEDMAYEACAVLCGQGTVTLCMEGDAARYSFGYALGDAPCQHLCRASVRLLSCELAYRSYTGCFLGLYASGNGKVSQTVACFQEIRMVYADETDENG